MAKKIKRPPLAAEFSRSKATPARITVASEVNPPTIPARDRMRLMGLTSPFSRMAISGSEGRG
jgi:hypothetical protein